MCVGVCKSSNLLCAVSFDPAVRSYPWQPFAGLSANPPGAAGTAHGGRTRGCCCGSKLLRRCSSATTLRSTKPVLPSFLLFLLPLATWGAGVRSPLEVDGRRGSGSLANSSALQAEAASERTVSEAQGRRRSANRGLFAPVIRTIGSATLASMFAPAAKVRRILSSSPVSRAR